MVRTQFKSPQLAPSKTTDSNGWTIYDYGTWKEYRKRVTFSQTIAGGVGLSISSNVLPTAISSIGTNFLSYSYTVTGNAFDLNIVFEGSTANTVLGLTASSVDTVSRAYTGFIDFILITP